MKNQFISFKMVAGVRWTIVGRPDHRPLGGLMFADEFGEKKSQKNLSREARSGRKSN